MTSILKLFDSNYPRAMVMTMAFFLFMATGLAFPAQADAAAPPTITISASGSSANITANDAVTSGFDIYLDGAYFMSVNNITNPVTVQLSGQTFCSVTAAAWEGGGLNHSAMSNLVQNPACGGTGGATVLPLTGNTVCIDSTAFNPNTNAILSTTTHCF